MKIFPFYIVMPKGMPKVPPKKHFCILAQILSNILLKILQIPVTFIMI